MMFEMVMEQMVVKEVSLMEKIDRMEELLSVLAQAATISEKNRVLDGAEGVKSFVGRSKFILAYLQKADPEHCYAVKALIALGQGSVVFRGLDDSLPSQKALEILVDQLLVIDRFYSAMGGLIGYHLSVLKLIRESKSDEIVGKGLHYEAPEGIDLAEDSPAVHRAVRAGIEALPYVAEMYPVGGAGDRLNLRDLASDEALPAALLPFGEGNLLEGLVRDLQAREYLYFKLTGDEVLTPLAMMTSHEKHNYRHILDICGNAGWFGRSKELFRLFIQPLVPVITIEGNWVMAGTLQIVGKPGGHGVIWREALSEGIFDWFSSMGRKKILVRQINNPLAGTDHSLIALIGVGVLGDKAFGTASCPRRVNAAEGMLVMVASPSDGGVDCGITNIEYTEFKKRGIEDVPSTPGGQYSRFPSNTNTLFVDLERMSDAAKRYPIPGMIINMKSTASYIDADGFVMEVPAGRLESTMQNVADFLSTHFPQPLSVGEQDRLSTFVTYNLRRKTSAVTKSLYQKGQSTLGTPDGAFYELMVNAEDLLRNYCRMAVPEVGDEKMFLNDGPPFVLQYHPALGPLFSVIGQKVRGGRMEKGAELRLEIAEADIEGLTLEGSLIIAADAPIGAKDSQGIVHYTAAGGRCILKNVTVRNRGIDREADNCYWSSTIMRHESVRVILNGNSEFVAENVIFEGDYLIEVPDGWRWIAVEEGGRLRFDKEKVGVAAGLWQYVFDKGDNIVLSRVYQ
jgi:hypothetical protein